jgi:bifunctional UDP-N-acetylglucosamine pyrophosphorylase / glucosamine-1-phosphate N-acetyltransferase
MSELHTENSTEQMTTPLNVLIMAAGLGTRMKSDIAKVLHQVGGRPLINHVCAAAAVLSPKNIFVIVGHQASAVEAAVMSGPGGANARFVLQREQRGTGDAVKSAETELRYSASTLLVLSGDVPLVSPQTLASLVDHHQKSGASCTLLSVVLPDPTGYGRVIRNTKGEFEKIVEQKDSSPAEAEVREINAGIYCFNTEQLFPALDKVTPANSQGEYYLTDVPGLLLAEGFGVSVFQHDDPIEVSGINTRAELAEFELIVRSRVIRRLMLEQGVTFIDPLHTYVGMDVQIGRDSTIYPNVYLEGETQIGERCEIRSGSRISNARIGNDVLIKDHTLIFDSEVGDGCSVGPFPHLRMRAVMEPEAVVGNFVEMKKSTLGRGSKSMHLTYLGDATIGSKTNIGAGTITCNYDGKHKHPTFIADNVKIGSDTMLVAPVRVESGAITAAGSVVTEDVPANTLVAGVPARVKKKLGNNNN